MNQELANSQAEEEVLPPNGGLEAWLRVLAGHFIFVNTWQALQFKRSHPPNPKRSTSNMVPISLAHADRVLGVSQLPLEHSSIITRAISCPPKAHQPYPGLAAYRPSWSS